ncbi:hypothetical protein [Moheibacter sediminis]|uniref:Uncharacterized protein n=1 Tax=Moheibacter sediminis TaxID=1434700 RepID=A0A1W1Y7T7_9FLAO|nr:hypothetical protein [Moheibacter sediminis]SMC32270.1 hypothetical protein SAMN06296427_10167 [Moheibacter sediminis]
MIKKLNKYLLENHPLVWNTRLVWMLLIMGLMHIGFFVIGFFAYFSAVDLHDSDLFDSYLESGFVWIGILLSILILILWMNQYFKQNAFKFHYPKSKLSLFKEFLIIFLISLLCITQYFSYTKGLQIRVSGLKTTEQLEKEIDLTNLAAAFALQSSYYGNDYRTSYFYSQSNRCVDVPAFDSLVSKDEVLKLHVSKEFKRNVVDYAAEDTINYHKFPDSIFYPLYKNDEFEDVLIRSFPKRKAWRSTQDYKTNEPFVKRDNYNGYYEEHIVVEDVSETASDVVYSAGSSTYQYYNLNSIYNYCGVVVNPFDSTKTDNTYAKQVFKLLNEDQKTEIQALLNNYQKLADEYEVGYRFKDKKWIDYVYNPPYYFVDYELTSPSRYDDNDHKRYKKDYFAQADMERSLKTIIEAKSGVIDSYSYLIVLYIALGISLLVYTFRITTMRTWVISVVGSIVVFFVYFCLYFAFGMLFSTINETYALILVLSFIFLFFILASSGILCGKRKLITGVNFIWSIWTFGFIFPILLGLYRIYLEWKYPVYLSQSENVTLFNRHPHIEWMNDHSELILSINLVLVFLFLILIIPAIKKWKAMPEE